MKFSKDSTLGEVLQQKGAEQILMGFGLHCFCCPCAQGETIEEACAVHEIPLDLVLEKLNS